MMSMESNMIEQLSLFTDHQPIKYSKKYDFSYTDDREYNRKWCQTNRHHTQDRKEYQKKYQQINRWKYRYGITLEEKDKMIQDQDNKCLRCGLPFEGRSKSPLSPVVDHDHSFKQGDPKSVRGIIHHKCNLLLGYHEDIEEYQRSMDYLKKHGVK